MQDVYIIDGSRTPFIKAGGQANPFSAADLAVAGAQPIFLRQPITSKDLDEVVAGCVSPSVDEANIARIIALRLGCGHNVTGWSVHRNCASGLQAIDCALKDIACGRHDLVLAGGTEAMSRTPLLYNNDMTSWFVSLGMAKSMRAKLNTLIKFRPKMLKPVIALIRGLTDPVIAMSMGQTAEKLAYQFGITRVEMDEFAVNSHLKATAGREQGNFNRETCLLMDWDGQAIDCDNGIRTDSSLEKLSKLKPVFDKPYGNVTAGNSSQITDGAAFLLLASQKAVEKHNLVPIGRILDVSWSGVDPSVMGLGPAHAIAKLLTTNYLAMSDIDFWEINEAFAAQVLACIKAMADPDYCRDVLELSRPLGMLDQSKLNVNGGAIALGHPVGASGARLTLHLLQTLRENNAKTGVASLCIGGGQGGAILLENVLEEV